MMSSDAGIALHELTIVELASAPMAHVFTRQLESGRKCGPVDFNPKSRARLACLTRHMCYTKQTFETLSTLTPDDCVEDLYPVEGTVRNFAEVCI